MKIRLVADWQPDDERRHARRFVGALLVIALAAGCASAPPVEEVPSAESYYQRALETLEGRRVMLFFHDVDYPKAIEYFQEVIDNYPYSEFSTLAELKIADIHYDQGSFAEAASYYQDFVELHPNHKDAPYAIYRNGLCSFAQIRAVDRDQGPTREAIAQFTALIDRFPDSEAAQEALQKRGEAQEKLARHAAQIADFYFDRREYAGAITRYREVLSEFPEYSGRLESMTRLGVALARVKKSQEAESVLRNVLTENPDSDLRERVEDELSELAKRPPGTAARGLPPAAGR